VSWAIWITGLPGSGKSVIARAAVDQLRADDRRVTLLEMDAMRRVLTPHPTYSDAERNRVYRALVYVAATLVEAGVPVIIDATAHRRQWRDLARSVIRHFAEIQLECPIEVCREREATRPRGHAPAGIYAAAGRPGATVPGVDVDYEHARAPELVIDTVQQPIDEAATAVAALARRFPPGANTLPDTPAWVMWVTGLPGSGKTTLAWGVAERLKEQALTVHVLDLHAARAAVTGGSSAMPDDDEIAHLALAYAAKSLSEAGVAVIVDATAPRRVWRERARALIPHFAEVQLLCPEPVCGTRERAVRWHLADRPRAAASSAGAPDVVTHYEYALRPDLTIHTDVEDPWTAVDELLCLARRLAPR
jgi:adenylylsulfate kinase